MLGKGQSDIASCRHEVAVAEEIHSINVPFDEDAWRVRQVEAELRASDRNGSEKRLTGGDSRLVRTVTRGLRRSTYFSCGIENVDLHGNTKMTTFPADDVVLVAGSDPKRMEVALHNRTDVDGLAIPDNVVAQGGSLRRPKWDDDDIEMVFVGEFPVHFAGEGRVRAEVQVLAKIHWDGVTFGPDGSGRVGVKPCGVELDFVLIELVRLLSLQIGNEENHYQNGKS